MAGMRQRVTHAFPGHLFLAYLLGAVVLNERVRLACWHPNCQHGWYSQYTGEEQMAALAWIIGWPAVLIGGPVARYLWRSRRSVRDPAARSR